MGLYTKLADIDEVDVVIAGGQFQPWTWDRC